MRHPQRRRTSRLHPVVAWLVLASSIVMPGLLPGATTPAVAAPGPDGQDPTSCLNTVALANGGFEQPVFGSGVQQLPQTQVPGWSTTASDGLIELWKSGFNGVPASSGTQFAELNATQVSTLYQDVPTNPGQTLYWSLDHRGRQGFDTMALDLGAPGGPVNYTQQMRDGNTAWGKYSGTYTVPAGQTTTRFAFRSVSAAGGNQSLGNFLDNISFGTGACLVTTKTQTNISRTSGPAQVGDIVEYTVTTTNQGGSPATGTVITDPIPTNTAYVPGTLSVTASPTAGQTGTKTDAVDGDVGSYSAGNVRFNVGDGATGTTGGTLEPGAAVTTKFRTRILPTAAEQTITNQASVAYTDRDNSAKTSLSGRVTTTVAPAADLAISKTSTPATQTAGSNVTYNVTVTNNGPSTAQGVQFVDTLPAGVSYVSSAPPSGTTCSVSGRTVTCTIGSLANGASVTVPITTTIAPATTAAQVNTATVSSTTSDYNTANDTATAQTTVTTSADLSLAKTASPTTVAPGNNVTYTLTARNAGPSVATAVNITDVLPSGMSFVSATAPGATCTESNGTVTCRADSLAVGGTITITIVAKVGASTPVGQLTNTGRISATTTDPNAANNTASVTVNVAPQADLQVTKTSLTNPVVAGQQARFSIRIVNNGPSDATNVTLTDPTPAGTTFLSANTSQGTCTGTGTVSCQIGTIAAGASVTVTLAYTVDPGRQTAITNTATATSDTSDPNQGNNTGSVTVTPTASADLQISKTQTPQQFNYGDTIDYTLSVLNNGPSTARSVVITDTLPAGVTFVSASSGCSVSGQTVTCAAGDLDPQQTASVTIRVRTPADGSGPLSNTARVSSATTDPVAANNTATYTASGGQEADVAIVKTTSGNGTLVAGQQVTYTLRVSNNGPSAASGITVRDTLPAGVSYVSSSGATCSASGQTVTCTFASLEPGAANARTITIVGQVGPDVRGTSGNTATVSSETPADPTTSDNTSTSTSNVVGQADVFVSLTPDTQTVNAGSEATFQLVVGNNGPSTARNVVVTGQVPPGMTPVLGSSGGACTVTGGTVTCNFGTLQPGQTLPPITLRARVEHDVAPGTSIDLTAEVQSSTTDTNNDNNVDSARVNVTALADLAVTKSVQPSPLVAGGQASFIIDVTNNGPSDARTVVLTDQIPAGFQISSANIAGQPCTVTGQTVSCSRPLIASGDVIRIVVAGTVAANATGSLSNTATVTSATPDNNQQNNSGSVTAPITQSADLQVTKQAPARVVAGSEINYQITVANTGPSDAAGVVVNDVFPAGVRPTQVSDPACTITDQTVRCNYGTVAAGTSRTVIVEAVVDPNAAPGSTLRNTASVTSTTPGGGTRDATAVSTVDASADVSIVKRSASTPVAGGIMRYELTVTNNGPSVARSTIVNDATPAGALFIDAVPSSGSCSDPTQGPDMTCTLGEVQPGQSITILVRYQLDARSNGQTLSNTARVTTTTSDPNAANNTSTTTDSISDAAKLTINKEIVSGAIVAGGTVTYRITVGNDGPSVARGVRVADTIEAPAEYVSATADGGGTCQAGGTPTTVLCDWGTLGVGAAEARTITLTVRIPADVADGSQITNSATATSQTPAEPVVDEVTGTVGSSADVSVTKTLLTANPVAGAPIAWQVTVRNAGPSIARAVSVDDPAPTGVRITGGTPDTGSCTVNAQGGLSCQLGDLAPGAETNVRVEGVVGPDFTGDLTNRATATSSTADPDTGNNTGSTTNPVGGSADLALVKTPTTERATAGGAIGWTVTVTNNGPSDATGVQITDAVPAGVTGATATVNGTPCTLTDGTFSCPVDRIAAGGTATVTLTGTVDPAATGQISNTASVTAATPDPNPTNNGATSVVPLDAAADLSITKTGPQTAVAGTEISWTVTVRNAGPSVARAVVLTDPIPAGINGAAATVNGNACAIEAGALRCPVGDLAPNASVEITVTGTVDQSQTEPVVNTATVDSQTTDPNGANDTATTTTEVTGSADLSISKVADRATFTAGQPVGWTLTARNDGPSTATGVQVTDQLPAGLTGVTATLPDGTACQISGGTVTCPLGVLGVGETRQIQISATLAADYAESSLPNSAQISGQTPDPDEGDNTSSISTPVDTSADVEVDKRIVGEVVAGSPITFEVTVTNNGPSLARNVRLADAVPTQISGITVDDGACTVTGQNVACGLGDLAAGATRTVRITGTVSQSFDDRFRNTATVTSDTPDPNEQNNSGSADGVVGESADVQVTKTGPEQVTAGAPVIWTIQVRNAGPSIARTVTVNDQLPAGLVGAQLLLPNGQPCADPTNCAIGDLAPGQTATLTVTGTVAPDYAGATISNSVAISTPTADPDGGNNDDTSTVAVNRNADLSISKALTTGPLVPGTQETYTITVRNTGPSTADAVTVADRLPAGLSVVGTPTSSTGQCTAGDLVTCELGTLAPNATVTIDLVVQVDANVTGDVVNVASVTSTTPDGNTGDNSATSTEPTAPSADVSVTKTLQTANPVAGSPVVWEVTVSNAGPSTARAITLSDPAPAGVRLTGGTPDAGSCAVNAQGGLDCQLGDLATGDRVTVLVEGTINSDFTGELSNRATATSATADPNGDNNTGVATNPVASSADLALTKTATTERATAGGAIGWTVTVTNNGPSDATGVQIRDAVPAGVTNPTVTVNGTPCPVDNGTYSCPVDRIAPGGTATVTITGTVDPAATGEIANTASVTAATPDPNGGNNEATSVVPLDTAADVSVTKAGPQTAVAGTSISWTVTVRNTGPSTARGVLVTDPIPAGINGATASVNGTACAVEAGALRCPVGDLAPGAVAEITVTGTVDQGRTEPVVNTATVESQTTDPNGDNNTATTTTEITASADLTIAKAADPGFTAGETIGWTITARNDGPSAATAVTVTDQLPAGVTDPTATLPDGTPCQISGGTVTCPIGTLAAGETRQIRITGTLAADHQASTLANTAQITSPTPDPETGDNSVTTTTPVDTSADVEVDKKIVGSVVAGAPITFEVTVTNNGPSLARNVRVTDPVPSQVTGVSVDDPACTVTGQDVACGFGDLAVGATRTIRITGTVSQSFSDQFTNTATVTSDTPDPNEQNNSGSADGVVGESADLQVTKTGPAQATAGAPVSWTITVTNAGPSTARAVSIDDQLPAGLDNARIQLPNGQTCADATNCAIGDLASGQTVTLTVTGTVAPDYADATISNSVAVNTPTADPDGGNNNDTSTVPVNRNADLSISKALTTGPLVPGTQETYTITVRNGGPSTADGVTVADRLPEGMTIVGTPTSTAGQCTAGPQVSCDLGTLAPGATATIQVTVQVDPNVTGEVANVASVTSTTPDGNTDDNSATSTEPSAPSADVAVTKSLVTPDPVAGSPIVWQVTVSNAGPSTARAITLSDPAPAGVTITGGTPGAGSCAVTPEGGLDCQLGDLAPDGTITIRVEGTVGADFTGDLTNRATATSSTTDPNPGNNSGAVTNPVGGSADLALTKTATTERATAGGAIGWTVTVTNNGPSDATGVRITDALPANVTGATATLNGTPCPVTDGTFTCAVDRIPAGGTATVTITGTVDPNATGEISNTANVTADTPDPNEGTNTATSIVPLDATADVSITKTGPQSAVAGTEISWTVTVRNAGPSVARGVLVSDQIPAGINGATASVGGTACAIEAGALRCPVGDLAPNASVEITVTGTVDQGRTEPVVNTATIESPTADPNGDNNTATTTTEITSSSDLTIGKVADSDSFIAGGAVGWTLVVGNDGPSTATGVQVTDQLPAGVTNPTATLPDGTPCQINGGTVTCPIGTLAAGETRQIRITGTLAADFAGTGLANTAQVTSPTADPDDGNNTSTITTPVNTAADLEVDKRIVGEVVAGSPVTFEVTVTNNGPSLARGVRLADPVPTQISGITVDDPNCAVTGQDVTCGFGDLAVGATRTVRITGTVSQSFNDQFTNTATVTSDTPDPNEQNNSGSADGTVGESADVQVTKTGPEQVTAGSPVTWTIEVRNAGPSTARAVTVNDQLPAGLTGAQLLLPNGQPCADPTNCVIGDLASGQSVTLTVTGTVAPDYAGTTIGNSVAISTPTADPDGGSNDDTSTVAVTRNADLSISKALTTGPLVPGTQETYTITVRNGGPSTADAVTVADRLPDGLTIVGTPTSSAGQCTAGQLVTCDLGTVAPGATVTIQVTVQVDPNVTGEVVNVASVTSTTPDGNADDNSATSTEPTAPSADVSVTKTLQTADPVAGSPVVWEVTVSNAGPSTARAITLTDPAPAGARITGGTPDAGSCAVNAAGALECQLGDLAPGSQLTVRVEGTLNADFTGELTNSATATSATPDPNADNNTGVATDQTASSADLALTKTATTERATAGGAIGWTVTVTNNGPSDATGVRITDAVPAGVTGATATVNGTPCTLTDGTFSCPIDRIPAGGTATVTLTGTVDPAATGQISNTASVTATTPDPNQGNNEATSVVPLDATADVSITKSGPQTAVAGTEISWTVTVGNTGPSTARGVVVTDPIPAGINGAAATVNGTRCAIQDGALSCPVGDLAPGSTVEIVVTGTVDQGRTEPVVNTATVGSQTTDPAGDNNTATTTTEVTSSADLTITKAADTGTFTAGQQVGWTLTARNDGPSVATAVTVTDQLPAGITNPTATLPDGTPCQIAEGTISCPIGTLASGETRQIRITGTLAADYAEAALANTAQITSPTADPETGDNSVTTTTPVATSADLEVDKRIVGAVVAGSPVTFEVTVTNNGPSLARNVRLTDPLPSQVTGATVDDPACTVTGQDVSCGFGDLAVGATRTIRITGTVSQSFSDQFTNTATVTSDTPDPNEQNNSGSADGTVGESADLQVTKTGPAQVTAGESVTWTIEVRNAGPSTARTVTVDDQLPAGLTGAQVLLPNGQPCADPTNCAIGDLTPGQSVTLTVTGTVAPDYADGTIANTVSADTPTADPDGGNNNDTSTVAVNRNADLSISKALTTGPLVPGTQETYTITVRNGGPSTAEGVTVADRLPDGLSVVGTPTSSTGPCTVTGQQLGCDLGTVAPNATVTIEVTVQVDANVTGEVVNVASVTATTPDGNTDDNSATSTEPSAPSADVSLTKTLLTDNPVAGSPITWQITVSNAGPSTARAIVVDDPAPTGVTITAGTPDAGNCAVTAAGALECQLGDLAPDGTITIRVEGTVNAAYTGELTNRATATSNTPDPNPGNNSDDATSPVAGSADLALTKTATTERATAGGAIGWTVTVTNNGPSDATGVQIRDAVPAGVTGATVSLNGVPCPVTDGTFTCSVDRIAAGGTATVTVTGTVDPAVTGEVSNTASVTAATPDPNQGNNEATSVVPVDTAADVSVTKTGPQTAVAGTEISWTVTVRNAGPSVARAVVVSDQIPAGINGATATVGGAACAVADGSLRCQLGDLAPGASVEVIVTGTVDQGRTEPVVNTATVGSQTTDPAGDNNTATTSTEVTSSANLSITKVADSGTFTAGQQVGWTLTARNDGPSTAVGVVVTDQLPAGVTNPTATLPDGTPCQLTDGTISCPIGALASGEVRQIRVTGTLAADHAGTGLANTAQISGQTPDPDQGDNTSTITTPVGTSADVEVDKKIVGSVVAGAPITFEVTVTNNGPSLARNVRVTDPVPSQVTGVSVDDPACTVTGQDVACGFGDLAVGATRTVRITGTVSQSFDDRFTNTATVTSDTPDPNEQNNSGSADGVVGESADVQVAKTGPEQVTAGAPVSWTITVTNTGPSTARTVSVDDQLPAGLVDGRVLLPNGQPCADPTNCAIGDLASGQTVTLTVTGTVAPDYAGTAITNAVRISTPTADPDGGNNDDTSTVAVNRNADLSISKELTTGPLVPGTQETYTITVRNGGPSTATNVTVADRLPDGLSIVGEPNSTAGQCAITGQQVDCELGTIAPNATVSIEIVVQVDATLTGDVVNVASVTGTTPDGNTDDNSSTSTEPTAPQADLTVTKTGPETVVAGQPISWTLTVQNAGPSFASGVTLRDELPAGLTGATVRTDQGQCRIDAGGPSGIVNCDLGTLGVGDQVTVTIVIDGTVSAAYTGDRLVNTATITSPTPEPGGGEDGRSDDSTTTVTRDADLSVTKTHEPGASVIPGAPGPEGLATWTVLVTNDGPSTARNATVTDTLPAGLTDVTFQTPDGVTCTPTGACTLGTLEPGQTVSITVSGRLPADYAEPQVVNRAGVGSEDPDGDGSDNTSTDAIPVDRSADVQVTKTGPAQVVAGTGIAWELRVVNNGPSTADGVVLTDRIPAGLGNPQVTAPAGMTCAIADGLLTCRATGALAPGDANALTVRLTADVPADRQEPIGNTAEVTSSTFDGTGDNNTSTTTTEVTGSADLSLTKAINTEVVANGTVTAGQPVAWTITVRNDGPSVARAVTVTDLAPAAVRDLTLTSTQGSCTANRCELGDLAPGQTVTIQVRGTVDPDASGIVGNSAEVTSPTGDPDPGDNRDDADPITIARSADLSVTKTADPAPAVPGAQLRYTITVRNAGPSTAQQATVTDALPAGLENPQVDDQRCAITDGVLTCALGTVPVGATQVITVTGTVAIDQQGDLSNTVSVTSPDPDPNTDNNSDQVGTPTSPANLSITKTAGAEQVTPGGELTWTLTVRNAGPGPARRVAVTDTLPAGVEVTSVVPSAGSCDPVTGQTLSCDPGVIPAGGTVTITIAATVSERALGALTNSASVTSPDDPDPSDNTSQVTTPVVATADLGVTKRVVSGGTVAGEPVSWEVTVRNDGPAPAVGVRLRDTLPSGVINPTLGVVPEGVTCTITGNALDCTAAELASGTAFSVTVTATVDPATRGELTNAASVTSDTRDPDPADNTGTTTSQVTGRSNVTVTKTASTQTATVGDQVRYTITATGSGPSTATGVTVSEQLPAGATVLDARTVNGSYQQGTWTIGDLAPGQTATLELVVRLDRAGQAANTVRIGAVEDPAGDDNTATATVTVNDKPVPPPTNPPTTPPTNPPTGPGQPPTGPGQPPTNPGQPPNPLPPGQPGQPPLPNTGSDWELWQLLLALGAIPTGIGLIAIGRKRRRRT
ncbi:hypothetical protein CGZ96_11275 [Enemella evansiae]|nr:hypothetical protein CGZ96_11275 [Enemella evansiae]